jgi:hypothetical protein
VNEKLNYYDAIAHLIPGTIGCLFLFYTFDLLGIVIPKPDIGSLGIVGIGVAVAYTIGHLLQSLASSLEPLYFAIYGGLPSVRLLEDESSQFSDEQRLQLIDDLVEFFKVAEKCPIEQESKRNFYQRLFNRCMTICNRNKLGRVEAFNAVYGFHRVLLTTFLLGFVTYAVVWVLHLFGHLDLTITKTATLRTLLVLTAIGGSIEVFRTRKRAYYYAREVLWMASDYIRSHPAAPDDEGY